MQKTVTDFTVEGVSALMEEAANKGTPIRFVNYASTSGTLSTFDAIPLRDKENQYSNFLRKSIEWLSKVERPSHLPDNAWFPAVTETRSSWEASLAGVNQNKRAASSREWVYRTPWVSTDGNESNTLRITMLERIGKAELTTEPAKVAHKSGLSEAKAWLRNNAPVSRLVFELILFPGKLDALILQEGDPK